MVFNTTILAVAIGCSDKEHTNDTATETTTTTVTSDADNDGYAKGEDCDDANPKINPTGSVVMDGGDTGPVVEIKTNGVSVLIDNLTLQNGAAEKGGASPVMVTTSAWTSWTRCSPITRPPRPPSMAVVVVASSSMAAPSPSRTAPSPTT